MGRDESNQTINYINSGQIPTIKFYQESSDKFIELKGEIPNFKNLSVNLINELESKNESLPNKVELFSIYPNPFNPTTQVNYSLDESYNVKINVFDINGKVVENIISKVQNSGNYTIQWNAKNKSSGIYFVKLIAENNFKRFSQTQKIMLIK